jgi:hypothetical protein
MRLPHPRFEAFTPLGLPQEIQRHQPAECHTKQKLPSEESRGVVSTRTGDYNRGVFGRLSWARSVGSSASYRPPAACPVQFSRRTLSLRKPETRNKPSTEETASEFFCLLLPARVIISLPEYCPVGRPLYGPPSAVDGLFRGSEVMSPE